jgi:hypothetical protein
MMSYLESLTKLQKVSPADEGTSPREKGFMKVGPPLIAAPQAAPLRQPGQGPLHDPARETQATAMRRPPLGRYGGAPQGSQRLPMGRRIGAPVPLDSAWPTAGAPTLAPHGRDGLQQGQPRGHVVLMRPGHQRRPGHPLGVCQRMMLTAALPTIGGMRTGVFPPRRPPEDFG